MRRRITGLVLCVALVLSMATGVFAVDASKMTDIQDHWAKGYITAAMDQGLFYGVSDTEFAPNIPMTRGMFVAVLGRMQGIDPEDYKQWYLPLLYSDVDSDSYYAPYINWATRYGIVRGVGDGKFAPDTAITREQMAAIVVRYASVFNKSLVTLEGTPAISYVDQGSISSWAKDAVDSLRQVGIMQGILNDDGTYSFLPQRSATRAECAAVFCRLQNSMTTYTGRTSVWPTGVTVSSSTLSLQVGDTQSLSATISPTTATNQILTWFSADSSIAKVDVDGNLTAVSPGQTYVYVYDCLGHRDYCTVTVTQKPSLASSDESYAQKCQRIFGEYVSDYDSYYVGKGDSHITSIVVPVWQFTDSSHTAKKTAYITLRVHKNLADTFMAIFYEIYNGSEQFPIYSAGCYRANESSEHGIGVAVDINWEENYECRNDGTALTGKYWKPGEDPYSIPIGGDVEKAFRKYGFGWGGTDWRSKHDYMHFSYFGT